MYRNLSNNRISYIRYIAVCLLVHCFFTYANAQVKYDYVWVFGVDAIPTAGVEGNILSFHDEAVSVEYEVLTQNIWGNNASICDIEGNLQFYTNGCNILDGSHEIMENGEMINPSETWDNHCPSSNDYPSSQDVIALPNRYTEHNYYLIHKPYAIISTNLGNDIRQSELLISNIDMSLNDGLGGVTSKNVQVDSSYNYCAGYGEAISHSNQLDWWYLDFEEGTNLVIKYLLDEEGMKMVSTQNIGEVLVDDFCAINGQSSFSPDGETFARFCSLTGLDVMEFDRETGELSNNRHLSIPTDYATSGVAFSLSSQFVYISTKDSLWQVDVTEEHLEDGLEFIAEYDGFLDPFPTTIVKQQLGPDCRIYISSTNGVSSMHVIRNPDAKGIECDFRQHHLDLPFNNGILSMPNFPHFRVDEDDVCDPTITSLFDLPIEVVKGLDVSPNPTSGELTIEMPEVMSGVLRVRSMQGEVVIEMEVDRRDEVQLDVFNLVSGLYLIHITTEDQITYVEKFIKQ